jgi:hypothetical protein
MYPSLAFEFIFCILFLTLYTFHDHFYLPLSTFYALKLLSYHFFGHIFRDVVETSHNLPVDAAGVPGHTAPKSADAAITATELAPVDAGEVEETRPQVVADGPLQLIRDICNRVSYPRATKTTSRANSGVAEKHTTPACARREVTQGNGSVRKKATQGGVSRKSNQSSPRRSARKTAGRKRSHSLSCSSSSSSSSSADSSVVSEELFLI